MLEMRKREAGERQDRIDRAVENYACRPQVEIDRERVQKETEAREIRQQTDLDKADQVKLFKNPGYTSDKLMSDVRYKISAALHDAGLQGSSYGNTVLQGLHNAQGAAQANPGTKGLF